MPESTSGADRLREQIVQQKNAQGGIGGGVPTARARPKKRSQRGIGAASEVEDAGPRDASDEDGGFEWHIRDKKVRLVGCGLLRGRELVYIAPNDDSAREALQDAAEALWRVAAAATRATRATNASVAERMRGGGGRGRASRIAGSQASWPSRQRKCLH